MAQIDAALPEGGLALGGVHELRPAGSGDYGAALGFALALLGRRLATAPQPAPILWAATDALLTEHGRPYGWGLIRFGIDPAALLFTPAASARDLAWALEEGVRSRALAAVLGQIDKAPPLLVRRLALASRMSRTPCLLVPDRHLPRLGPALTRWRIEARPSTPHACEEKAPGAPRWRIVIERCRWGAGGRAWTVEWSDAAYRFRLVAPMADRTPAAGERATLERTG